MTTTAPTPDRPAGIELGAVTEWLAATVGLRGPLEFTRIGNGQSNLTYLVRDTADRRVVLRRPPLGDLARGAHDMVREYRILSALALEPIPTPTPLAMSEDDRVTGAPVYVMEHVDGLVLDSDDVAHQLSARARSRAGAAAVEALAALHRVDVDSAGLGTLSRRDAYAERQLRGWGAQWQATKTRELPAIEATAELLQRRIPPQRELALIHGDYNLANLIIDADGEIRAILDWELSTLGDPVADLGTLLCYWPDRADQAIPERDPVALLPGFGSREELTEIYARAAPERDLSRLQFWLALATWKLAIIFEGITRRRLAHAGNSRTDPETLRRSTEHLALTAAALAAPVA